MPIIVTSNGEKRRCFIHKNIRRYDDYITIRIDLSHGNPLRKNLLVIFELHNATPNTIRKQKKVNLYGKCCFNSSLMPHDERFGAMRIVNCKTEWRM